MTRSALAPISKMVVTLRGWGIFFHSDVSNLCFSSDLALGDTLPPPHSPPAAELRFPPLLSQGKTKGLRQVVPRNTLSPERHIFGVKAIIIKDYSLT